MAMKILVLVMRVPEAVFFAGVAKCLGEHGWQMEFIAGHESACDVFEKNGLKYYNIHERARKAATDYAPGADVEKEREAQRRFKIGNIRDIYLREKLHFGRYNEQKMLKKTLVYLQVADRILAESKPDVIVQETGDFVAPHCLYLAARAKNIPHVFIEPGMFPNTMVFALNSYFAGIPSEIVSARCSDEELSFAAKFMQDYRESKPTRVPTKDRVFFKDMSLRTVVSLSNFGKLTRKLFHKYVAGKSEEYDAIARHCMSHLSRVFCRKLLSRFYVTELPDQPFFYYPLHVPLDLQLTTRCREYLDQLSLIEYISTCIPSGYVLLTKEHPASIGGYGYTRIKSLLKRNTHVRLAHPSLNSYDIIERSRAVITINSKVGIEAVIQQKPVIVLGPTFYRGRGLTIDVGPLKDLPEAVRRALVSEKLDGEMVRDFLASVYKWSWPGELFDDSPENIEVFSDSLWRYIKASVSVKSSADAVAIS